MTVELKGSAEVLHEAAKALESAWMKLQNYEICNIPEDQDKRLELKISTDRARIAWYKAQVEYNRLLASFCS